MSSATPNPGERKSNGDQTGRLQAGSSRPWFVFAICAALVVGTFAIYFPVWHYEFVNYDDLNYVAENKVIAHGFTLSGVGWVLSHPQMGNWDPLVSISHMLDCQVFGLNAGAHHLMNVFLHSVNAVLLFFLLRSMTGAIWKSAIVAAFFAWHPLHVESVAWISERKDVLSGMFFFLTLLAYVQYVRRKTQGKARRLATLWFALSVVCFGLGLMSKTMLVTVPFVLLLLDFWPLQRIRFHACHGNGCINPESAGIPISRIILEKLPFFALALLMSAVAMKTQYQAGALESLEGAPFSWRLSNAAVSYLEYLRKMFWPNDLIVFYPRVSDWSPWRVGGAASVLIIGTVAAATAVQRTCYIAVGWFWFVGMLLPVIGLVQIGRHGMADRYTYLPLTGMFIAIVWSIAEFADKRQWPKALLSSAAVVVLLVCGVTAGFQVSHWRNSITLFEHALAVWPENALAHESLGNAFDRQGKLEEAIVHYESALRIKPDYAEAHLNLGIARGKQGRFVEAIEQFQIALRQKPDANTFYNLGFAFLQQHETDRAKECFATAVQLQPDHVQACNSLAFLLRGEGKTAQAKELFVNALRADAKFAPAHFNLGQILETEGKSDEALAHYLAAVRAEPDYAEAHANAANLLSALGKVPEAIEQYSEALRLHPDFVEAHVNIAALLVRMRRPDEAIAHCSAALKLNPNIAEAHYNMANAYFLQGKLKDAIREYETTLQLNPQHNEARQNLSIAQKQSVAAQKPN